MSPSKRANNKATKKKTLSARKTNRKLSARSSRAASETELALVSPAVPPAPPAKSKRSKFLTNVLRVLALLAVIGITFFVYSIRDRVEEFQALGYWGGFLIALLANATIVIPAPGVAIIYWMGTQFNPFGLGLAAGTGGTIGELSGYLAGFSGQAVIERVDRYSRIKPMVDKYGGWAILLLSAIPNPFFDVAGIAAGIAKMPLRTFLIFTWIGQIIKMTLFALAGHYSVEAIKNFMK